MSPDPDFAWLEAIVLSEGPPDEVVQAGGVAVVVRRREALQAYERALHAARDPARDRTRDLVLDSDDEIEAAAVRIARDRG